MATSTFPALDLDLVDVTAPFSVHHEPTGDDWGYEMPPALLEPLVRPAPMQDPALAEPTEAEVAR